MLCYLGIKKSYIVKTILFLKCYYKAKSLRPFSSKSDTFLVFNPCGAQMATFDLFANNSILIRHRNVKLYIFWTLMTRRIIWYRFLKHLLNLAFWPLCKLWPWNSQIAQGCQFGTRQIINLYTLNYLIKQKNHSHTDLYAFPEIRALVTWLYDCIDHLILMFGQRVCSRTQLCCGSVLSLASMISLRVT